MVIIARSVLAATLTAVGLSGGSFAAAAEAPASDQPPVIVAGHWTCSTSRDVEGTVERVDLDGSVILSRKRGWAWQQDATMDDPRLQGDHVLSVDWDEYIGLGGVDSTRLGTTTWRIENDAGAWQGSFVHLDRGDDSAIPLAVLTGEGDHAGLTAILQGQPSEAGCGLDIHGLIVAGTVPTAPTAIHLP
jgi:hypothetical protein